MDALVRVRYRFIMSYDGTGYSGWQYQQNTPNTIQQILEKEIAKIVPMEGGIIGCGRTDAGVHAQNFSFHLNTESPIDISTTLFKLSKMLPPDLAVHEIMEVDLYFHARFTAVKRSYVYHIRLKNDPFDNRFKWVYPYRTSFNLEKLNEAASLILEYEDFTTFSKAGSDSPSKICQVSQSYWVYDEATFTYSYYVSSNRFLRGMIRLIVGMCINYMESKLELDQIRSALESKGKLGLKYSYSVPAKGLCLYEVIYPGDEGV